MVNQAVYLIIAARALMNSFMVAADMFERGKVLGNIELITVTYKPGEDVTLQRAAIGLDIFKQALEQSGYIVSLVHLLYVERGHIIERNIGIVPPYVNKEVRTFSNGEKWCMMDDFLHSLGWEVKTDQHRFITSIG